MAITSSGTIVLNAYQLCVDEDLDSVIESARSSGRPVFIGVVLDDEDQPDVMRDIHDASADIVGRLGGRMQARRRRQGDPPR